MKYWDRLVAYWSQRMLQFYTLVLLVLMLWGALSSGHAIVLFFILATFEVEEHLRELRRALVPKPVTLDTILHS